MTVNAFVPHEWKAAARAVAKSGTMPQATFLDHRVIIAAGSPKPHAASIAIDFDEPPAADCSGRTTADSDSALFWDTRSPATAYRDRIDGEGVEIASVCHGYLADYLAHLQAPGHEIATVDVCALAGILPHTDLDRGSAVLTGVCLRDGRATATNGKTLAQCEIAGGTTPAILQPWAVQAAHKAPGCRRCWHVYQSGPTHGSMIGYADGATVTIRGPIFIDGQYPDTGPAMRRAREQATGTIRLSVSDALSACAEAQRGVTRAKRRHQGMVSIVVQDGRAVTLAAPKDTGSMHAVGRPVSAGDAAPIVVHLRAEYLRLHALRARDVRAGYMDLALSTRGVLVDIPGQPEGLMMPIAQSDYVAAQAQRLAQAHSIAEDEDPGRYSASETRSGDAVRNLRDARRLAAQGASLLSQSGYPASADAAEKVATILRQIAGT
jgi:hypothetical protein